MRRSLLLAVLSLGILLSPLVVAHAASYTFTTIDVPGAIQTNANGINSRGQIVGVYYDSLVNHGFLDDAGTLTTLDVPGGLNTVAFGINKTGHIVGKYQAQG